MIWYAETPARRTRQAVTDLAMLVWLVGCLLLGRFVHDVVSALAAPAYGLRDASHRVDAGLAQTSDRLADVPLVGDRLRGALDPLSGANGDVDRAAADFVAAVDRLALIAGVLAALLPILAVLVPWLWVRLRFARRAGAAHRLLDGGADADLFALRALAAAPLPVLAAIDRDPAGAWRRGDPDVVGRLAALELRRCGLRPRPAPVDR